MMGKTILLVLLGGLLVLGMSTAFAEEQQLSDQETLKAWGQVQTDAKQISEAATLQLKQGPQALSDEELDQLTAGWSGAFGIIANGNVLSWSKRQGRNCWAVGIIATC